MADRTSHARRSDFAERNASLALEWKRLSRAATFVALLTAPAFFAILVGQQDIPIGWAILITIAGIAAFRGLIDMIAHRLIPRASLYGADREALLDDATARRRLWFWRGKYRFAFWLALPFFVIWLVWGTTPGDMWGDISDYVKQNPYLLAILFQLPLPFFANFLILFGPMLVFG